MQRYSGGASEASAWLRSHGGGAEGLGLMVGSVIDYAIFMLDTEGRVLTWNEGAHRLKQYEQSDIVGRHFSVFYPPEARAEGRPQRLLAEAMREGRVEDQGWRVRQDGSRFWADVVITAVRGTDHELRGFCKVTRDLTERRAAEEALRESEERLRLMVESVVDYAIFMLDPEGRVATWNEGAHRLKQYEAAEIVGRHFSVFYPPEDAAAGRPRHLLDIAERDGRVEDEGWRVRKDGTRFWADVVITALRGPRGELRGFAKVTRDLTERKRHEDSLRAAVDRERQAMDQLRETDRRRHELINMVAHDLRAPVGVMHGTADMMLRDWARLDEAARLRLLGSLLATGERLRSLVDDVLDVARIDSGSLRVEAGEVDLVAVVERAAGDVDAGAQRIQLRLPDEPVTVRGDERRIWQILTNLMGNAVKFSPAGSAIEVGVDAGDGTATVSVRDQGVGISDENQRLLFQPFARVGAPRGGAPGTGLGLYIAQALAAAQGGSIEVRSTPGAGSTFSVTLPRALGAAISP